MKFRDRNLLEPSGPLQACNGTALPLPLSTYEGTPAHTDVSCNISGLQSVTKKVIIDRCDMVSYVRSHTDMTVIFSVPYTVCYDTGYLVTRP